MDPRIQEIVDLLRADLRQDFSLGELAERVDLSPSRFGELFKTETGLSPKQYSFRLKLDRAQHLLLTTDLTIKAIMEEVGFQHKREFARQFKRVFDMSASRYRKFKKGEHGQHSTET